ncbi:MAG: GntR family transcriptional regulator [Clostridia bacterium]|nr:GntR family transcriptional regulator [Clostridia bacterium]
MLINFTIDRNAKRAAYRQIISGITTMVSEGLLVPGDRLPSEREMADMLDASRGTVKKAYDKLCTNGVAQSVIGSGTFISMGQDVIETSRKQQAIRNIEVLTDDLIAQGFSFREIETHFNLVLNKYKSDARLIHVVTIDCSPEALFTFLQQLDYISGIAIDKLLLNDLLESDHPENLVSDCDLILTTSTHYEEICHLLPGFSGKIMQAVLSPDRQTVIELAKIPKNRQVGAICLSERYLKVIKKFMTRDIPPKNTLLLENTSVSLNDFLADKDYLILPPKKVVENNDIFNTAAINSEATQIIYFNYQIERGSLIHIEEKISYLLKQKLGRYDE